MLSFNFETKRFQSSSGYRCKTIRLNPERYKYLVYTIEGQKEDLVEIIDMYEFRDIHQNIFNEMSYNPSESVHFNYDKYDVFKKIYRHEDCIYSVYSFKVSGS
jgi:uncharacterized protein YukJ